MAAFTFIVLWIILNKAVGIKGTCTHHLHRPPISTLSKTLILEGPYIRSLGEDLLKLTITPLSGLRRLA